MKSAVMASVLMIFSMIWSGSAAQAHHRIVISSVRTVNLPPGLAKRGGNLPPGLEKHLMRTGELPPGLQKRAGNRAITIVIR